MDETVLYSVDDELKSCPCCGGQAILRCGSVNGKSSNVYSIVCGTCGLSTVTEPTSIREDSHGSIILRESGADKVIKLWNRRVSDA